MNNQIDLPILSTFTLGNYSLQHVTEAHIKSSNSLMIVCIEVPFINGKFTNGYLSLNKLISNNIEYDHGKLIIFLFH